MSKRPTAKAPCVTAPSVKASCVKASRFLFICAVAAALSGCDRCGDWWRPIKFEAQACRDEAPRPPQ